MHFIINKIKRTILFHREDWYIIIFITKLLNLCSIYILIYALQENSLSLSIHNFVPYIIVSLSIIVSTIMVLPFGIGEPSENYRTGRENYVIIIYLFFVLMFETKGRDVIPWILLFNIITTLIITRRTFYKYLASFTRSCLNKKVKFFFLNLYFAYKNNEYDNYLYESEFKDFVFKDKRLEFIQGKYLKYFGLKSKEYLKMLYQNQLFKPWVTRFTPINQFKYFITSTLEEELTEKDIEDFNYSINVSNSLLRYFAVLIMIIPLVIILKYIHFPIWETVLDTMMLNLGLLFIFSLVTSLAILLFLHNNILANLITAIYLLGMLELAKADKNILNYEILRWCIEVGLHYFFIISLFPYYDSIEDVSNHKSSLLLQIISAILSIVTAIFIVLYNPVIPIYLYSKDIWIAIDWIAQGNTLVLLVILLLFSRKKVISNFEGYTFSN